MSEESDALRELAANRGCRLRTSRRRRPGGDYGRYGLIDSRTGREVFGFGPDGLTASADEIRSFLRSGGESTWRTSLGKAEPTKAALAPERRRPRPAADPRPRAEPKPAGAPEAEPGPEPEPEPELSIREAKPRDAGAIAALIVGLGYDVGAADVKRRLAALAKADQAALVAIRGELVGVLSVSIMQVLHRPRPVGRISLLVVAEGLRGGGIGTALVEAAAERLKAAGCGLLEVTSNIKRSRAHGFYERLGFERTSYRFARILNE
ncbi:MAG TPA: GNAT family N-acetyltransferase [Allosphingosinicella sp.]|jgi:ribosomal protein S18 acetylase RimI-like enzyme